jgi:hypothetical protein
MTARSFTHWCRSSGQGLPRITNTTKEYIILGESYVHGIMHGEALLAAMKHGDFEFRAQKGLSLCQNLNYVSIIWNIIT